MAAAGRASNLSLRLHLLPPPPPPLLPPPPSAAARLSTPPMPYPNLFRRLGRKRPPLPPLLQSIGPISSSLAERPQQQQQEEEEEEISFTDPEAALVVALLGIQGRGRAASPQQLQEVERAVQTLETLKGVPDPTSSSLIEGCWQLVFTTRPGTASPIQRTFVGVDFFKIFQEVYLRTDDPRVSNVVRFSDKIGELKVEQQQ